MLTSKATLTPAAANLPPGLDTWRQDPNHNDPAIGRKGSDPKHLF